MSGTLDTLAKVLAQAENTTNEAERQLFMERAEQMAAKSGIDLAIARAHSESRHRQKPEKRSFIIGQFGAKMNAHKVKLFLAIAEPHDVTVTIGGSNIFCWGYGFPSDLDIVTALFDMMSVHMVGSADAALMRGEQHDARDTWGRRGVDGRIWRRWFYEGFISALTTRLWAARAQAMQDTGDTIGTKLVLADRSGEVEDFFKEETRHKHIGIWSGTKPRVRDDYVESAVNHGAATARSADIGLDSTKVASPKRGSLQ